MREVPEESGSANREIGHLVREVARLKEELAAAQRKAEGRDVTHAALLDATEAQAHIGRWEYVPAAREMIWSKEMYRLAGLEPRHAPLSIDDVLGLLHPDDQAALRQGLSSAQDEARAVEVRSNPARGPLRWFNVTMGVVEVSPGQPRIVGTQQDISERKRVEQELRESEQRLRQLFDLLPASISFSRKSDHVFLEVNRGFEQGSGLRREEAIGRSARDLDIWANAKERDTLLHILDTQGDFRGREVRVRPEGGRELQMSFSASSVVVGGEPGWLCVLTDVTALREAEQAVRENERRLQLLVENSTDILGVMSAAGVFLSLRGPLQRILGYEPEELVGHGAFDLVHPEDVSEVRRVLVNYIGKPYSMHALAVKVRRVLDAKPAQPG
jgi:PAS domain S-box-containing protein